MPFEDDEWAEADLLAEEASGIVVYQVPEQGIAAMEKRIAYLSRRLMRCTDPDLALPLARQLREARTRLSEYQAQIKARN